MDTTVITTGHLVLRPWEPGDAAAVHAGCQDPEVQAWTTVPSPYLPGDAELFVGQLSPRGWAEGTSASFAVLDATTGALLGAIGLDGLDGLHGDPQVGFWVEAGARGRGVAREAVSAVCRWAFGALGCQRVGWSAYVGNEASRAVALACGFVLADDGELVQRGVRRPAWRAWLGPDDVR